MAGFDGFFITIPDPCANYPARARQADFIGDDQVHGVATFQHLNVGMILRLADQRGFNLFAGGISRMQDASMAMAAFAGQVITLFTIGLNLRIKQNALINEPLDARSGVAGDELNCMAIAQSRAGNQRILDVRIDTVGFIKNSGNASWA